MTLKEQLTKRRIEEITASDEEVNNVVDKVKNVLIQMHERDVDKVYLATEAMWKNDKLVLNTNEEGVEEIPVTNTISSKKKQKEMLEKVEEKLVKEEGFEEPRREENLAIWSLHLLS